MSVSQGEASTPAAGEAILLRAGEAQIEAFRCVHDSGSGPGLLLVGDRGQLDDGILARALLFAEEGYSVLAIGATATQEQISAVADCLRAFSETDGGIVAIGHGAGGVGLLEAASRAQFKAVVAFDAGGADLGLLTRVPCPFVLQFGSKNEPAIDTAARHLSAGLARKDGSRIHVWPEAAPGFALPGRPEFDRRTDDLAHTRTLELIRRVAGPYYDFAALFAEHTHHEFTTRDVDATMATMIGEPYVNHVPTLAGGVGHDMLKRFYKYHFVEQNAGGRDRVRISYTTGPNQLVLESYTKFRHDMVIDRYFPGIEPTGKTVEIATVIIVKFRGDKVCHEHLYWDQGSALKQIGVLACEGLPVAGAEAARKVLDETLPSNIFMQDAWASSEGKPL